MIKFIQATFLLLTMSTDIGLSLNIPAPDEISTGQTAVSQTSAENSTSVWSTVINYFDRQPVLKLSLLVIIFSLSVSLIVYFNRIQKKRELLKRQLLMAEQKAVRSQMNPHFIFNSLNSIQNFILDNDQENANVYLVIFSKLIRRILEAMKVNFISLREEIETIKLYLELEKFRFSTRFEYNIDIAPDLNLDQISIPSMIMQPYLENAIWHGLVPKEGPGKLDIRFELKNNDVLLISITDNGIGRAKAAEITKKRKFHKSTGMNNVEERLHLLNQLNHTHARVEIIDLYNADSTPAGTRIELYLDV